MAQRLVMKTNKSLLYGEIKRFIKTADDYGTRPDEEVVVHVTQEKDIVTEVQFSLPLPAKVRVANGKRVVVRPKNKKQQAVEQQIKEHKEKKARGEQEAYVPPVGRKSAPKSMKEKCPVCNIRKPVIKQGAINVIKPHVSKGEPCEGSGTQVGVKKGAKRA